MRRLRVTAVLLVAIIASTSGSGVSLAASPARPIVLSNDALGPVRIGSSQTAALAKLRSILGRPEHGLQRSEDLNCGLDGYASWPHIQAFFFRDRFIGYDTGFSRTPVPSFVTTQGLRIGDTVTTARAIFGSGFRTSSEQGGSWYADSTRANSLYGYLTQPPMYGPNDRIAGIAAGRVGCPAMTP